LTTGCATRVIETPAVAVAPAAAPVFTAVGYGVESDYKNYPKPRQRLLAIRAAKLDAYRSLAEELNGARLRGHTTVKDAVIESDSYRAYVDAIVRGAHLLSVTPKGEGVYEAEVELRLSTLAYGCLMRPASQCYSNIPVAAMYAPAVRTACGSYDCNAGAVMRPVVSAATVVSPTACGQSPCVNNASPQVYYYAP
jgi:hypothetical protein